MIVSKSPKKYNRRNVSGKVTRERTIIMHSIQLTQHGLTHFIAGSAYNFRALTAGEKVIDDTKRALEHMQIIPDELYSGTQVHGVNIAYCDGKNGDEFMFGRNFPDTDGLITDQTNVALLIKYAD